MPQPYPNAVLTGGKQPNSKKKPDLSARARARRVCAQCKVTCARLAQNFNVFKMVVFASGAHIGYVLMFVACLQRFEVEIPGQN